MAHFARISDNNVVTNVIVVGNENITDENGEEREELGVMFLNKIYGMGHNWVQTSYNTSCGVHTKGGTPFRKNYAGVGMTYDEDRDAFIPPKPFDSWTLNEDTCQYDSPVAYPDDGKYYEWNEDTTSWDEVDMGAD